MIFRAISRNHDLGIRTNDPLVTGVEGKHDSRRVVLLVDATVQAGC